MGGMVRAVEKGYPQREIARSAYEFERAAQRRRARDGRREPLPASEEPDRIPTLKIDEQVQRLQIENLARVKAQRSRVDVDNALARGARGGAEAIAT